MEQIQRDYARESFTNAVAAQIHFRGNNMCAEPDYAELLTELFRPSPALQREIDKHLAAIDSPFIAAAFRFIQLLGDFQERYDYPVLPPNEREKLLAHSINYLNEIHAENAESKILVCADSSTFLQAAAKLPFVYVIAGETAHCDRTSGVDTWAAHLKIFVDYFVLSKAMKIYLICDDDLRGSGFARSAGLAGHVPVITRDYRENSRR